MISDGLMTTLNTNAQTEFATTYEPATIEAHWYPIWEQQGYFKPRSNTPDGRAFSIMIPPPNVTGSLHMGHGFNNTIMDALVRFHRMSGDNTLWQPGTDHAGIATQMVVERQLALQNISRHDLGRDAFIDKIWEWKHKSGDNITQQIRRLGSSVDWSRERFTLDDGLSAAVREVFVRLHGEGLIYRGKRLVNWDPKMHTALSDLEVENHEEQGSLWHFKYFFADENVTTADGKNYIVVATTRPETLLGDTAVAVNPDDARYQHLIGKKLKLPISGRLVPIIADDYVEQDFGSGCVKITPAHDFNDYEVGKRHGLPLINIFNADASLLADFEHYPEYYQKIGQPTGQPMGAPVDYAGLDRFVARKKLVAQAEAEGWLDKIEPYTLKAPRGDRSGVIVEPWLTDQWYVSIAPLAAPAITAVKNGDIKFIPESYSNMYMAWMNNIQDWCISRQLWWGHRIPAWYDENDTIYVGRSEAEVRQTHHLGAHVTLRQDEDVLDTWFSSALWTFSTLGWPEDTPELKTFHSTDVLVTGFDIIFFWVARMIMMSLHFVKAEDGKPQVPFKTVYVHGLVRDSEGQKMSKSKGNVLDPLDVIDGIDLEQLVQKRTTGLMNPKDAGRIEKSTRKEFADGIAAYGTDALRFSFCALANTGRDIKFDLKRVEGYRNFCNKIWNASRFVLMNIGELDLTAAPRPELWELPEHWIMSRLHHCITTVHQAFEQYRLDLAAQALYDFIWGEYCDWYLELTKPVFNGNASLERKTEVARVLLGALEMSVRLLHPIMPFLTEELWQTIAPRLGKKTTDTIMLAAYPIASDAPQNLPAEHDMQGLQGLIGAVRTIRGEMNLGNARLLPVLLQHLSESEKIQLERIEPLFKALAKVDTLTILDPDAVPPLSSSSQVGQMSVFVPMAGLIDPKAEVARLQKDYDKLQKQVEQLAIKLGNAGFIDKAPPAVVKAEQLKLAELRQQLTKVTAQIEQMQQL